MHIRLVVIGLVLLGVGRSWSASADQARGNSELASFRAVTTDQKARATFFDRPLERPLQSGVTRVEDHESSMPAHDAPEYASFIRDIVCGSDLIVTGHAVRKQSFLTTSDTSIFTDYAFAAEAFLRGSVAYRPGQPDSTLLVSLRGGTLQTRGGPVSVQNEEPLDLSLHYLLFLKRIPQTTSFELSGPHFTIDNATPRARGRHELPDAIADGGKSTNSLLNDVRSAAANCGRGGVR